MCDYCGVGVTEGGKAEGDIKETSILGLKPARTEDADDSDNDW